MIQQKSHPPELDCINIRAMILVLLHAYRRNLAEDLNRQWHYSENNESRNGRLEPFARCSEVLAKASKTWNSAYIVYFHGYP